jgi:hypothetical protein
MDIRASIALVEGLQFVETAAAPTPPPGYAPILKDRYEIAAYIERCSVSYVDVEFIEEHYRGAKAVLRLVPVAEVEQGSAEGNVRVKAREKRYAKMDPATVPPLVIEGGKIADGNHRFRVEVARGATHLWCYDVVDA